MTWQKRAIVLGAAAGAFFSPLTAQIYFPALGMLAKDLNVSITQVSPAIRNDSSILHTFAADWF